jgi:hypothetical protein
VNASSAAQAAIVKRFGMFSLQMSMVSSVNQSRDTASRMFPVASAGSVIRSDSEVRALRAAGIPRLRLGMTRGRWPGMSGWLVARAFARAQSRFISPAGPNPTRRPTS